MPDEHDDAVVRLLEADGTPSATDERNTAYAQRAHHLLDPDADPAPLRAMYRDMVLTRRFDTEATALQRQGELALFAPALGQEAAQIGSGHALAPQDYVFPSYREHGVALTRGMDLADTMPIWRGVRHGGWDPRAHNFHLFTLVIGSHPLHATGYAMAAQRRGEVGSGDPGVDMAVIAYFGDGATSQGDISEALGFAAVNQAPVVFFCQNNQWAISAPTSVQTRVPIYQRAWGFGVPSVRVDGNDVVATWAVTAEALERARNGGGPTFIEAVTFRRGAHTTSDDPTRYRTAEEEAYWAERDPLARVRARLEAVGAWSDDDEAALAQEADAFGEHVRTVTRDLQAPPAATMFDDVYATAHAEVQTERAWFERYQAELADEQTDQPVGAPAVTGGTR